MDFSFIFMFERKDLEKSPKIKPRYKSIDAKRKYRTRN